MDTYVPLKTNSSPEPATPPPVGVPSTPPTPAPNPNQPKNEDAYTLEIQANAQKRMESFERLKGKNNQKVLLILGGGLLVSVLVLIWLIGFVSNILSNTNRNEGSLIASPTPEPTSNISPTLTAVPTQAFNWKTITLSGRAIYTIPTHWEVLSEIPPSFLFNPVDETNSKMFIFPCNAGVYRDPSIPSTLIAVETYKLSQPGERCWSAGVTEPYIKRTLRSFNIAQEIDVKKWHPKDVFVDGVLKRGVWKKDLIQTYVVKDARFGTAIAFTLIMVENADYTSETLFDQMVASAKLVNPTDEAPTPVWKEIKFKGVRVMVPQEWVGEEFAEELGSNLILNPASVQGNELTASMLMNYRPNTTIADRKDELIRNLVLTTMQEELITILGDEATQLDADVGAGAYAGRRVRFVLFKRNTDVYVFQNNGIVQSSDALFTQMVSTIR